MKQLGKLPPQDLEKLLSCIPNDSRVVLPPKVGYDSGVHKIMGEYMAVSSDPCTGVPQEWFGFLLLNYASSDLALSGAKPEFCTVNLLGPQTTKSTKFQKIMKQICEAARELNIAIVRGHTGTYDSLNDVIGVCTVYGSVEPERLITPGGAKPNDLILATKPLGHEVLTNFSIAQKKLATKLLGIAKQRELTKRVPLQSCVKEAVVLSQIKGVHALHDATEGGFVAALNEVASASKLGLLVEWEKIPLEPEIELIKKYFTLSDKQILSMSSTGAIIAAVTPESKSNAIAALKSLGLNAYFIGKFTENQERKIVKEKRAKVFPKRAIDPYTLIVSHK
jgi:hydrogenase expression/formation protein HypE